MKFPIVPVLFFWVSTSLAQYDSFTIPHDLPDGDYRITYSEDRSVPPLVKRYSPVSKRWKTLESRKEGGSGEYTIVINEDVATDQIETIHYDIHGQAELPLPIDTKGCFRQIDYKLPADDYLASKLAFYNWCSLYDFNDGHIEMALRGSTAVYACVRNTGKMGKNYCSEGEYKAAEAVFNETCGELKPAYVVMDDWAKEYGRTYRGMTIGKDSHIYKFPGSGDWGKFEDLPSVDIGDPEDVDEEDDGEKEEEDKEGEEEESDDEA